MSDAQAQSDAEQRLSQPFNMVPIEVLVCVGTARPLLRDLHSLKNNTILTIDRKLDDPVDLYVGEHLIARGVLEEDQENPEKLVVRLIDVIDLQPSR
jgi:flagellar motor switch protein FliN